MKKTMLNTNLFGFVVFLLLSVSLQAQVQFTAQTTTAETQDQQKLDKYFSKYQLISLPIDEMYRQLRANSQSVFLELSIKDKTFSMHLSENQIYSGNAKRIVHIENEAKEMDSSPPLCLEGYCNNNPNDRVRLTITKNYLAGMIWQNGEEFNIEPARFIAQNKKMSSSNLVFYQSKNINQDSDLDCGTIRQKVKEKVEIIDRSLTRDANYCIEMGIVADNEYCAIYENDTEAVINTIINEVEDYYQAFVSLDIEITTFHPWFGFGDPFHVHHSSLDAIIEVEEFFAIVYAESDRDAFHLFTGRTLENHGAASGYGHICLDRDLSGAFGLGINKNTGSVLDHASQARIHGHELGHLLNAYHDFEGSCSGQSPLHIMAPCTPYGTSSTFSSQSRNAIISFLTNYGDCTVCSTTGGGGCFAPLGTSPDRLAMQQNAALFAATEIHYRAIDAQMSYIKHQSEINDILTSDKKEHTNVRFAFNELKSALMPYVMAAFISDGQHVVSAQDLDLLHNFLTELHIVSQSEKLKIAIKEAQKYLPVLQGKTIKEAIIAFDRATEQELTVAQRSNEMEQNSSFHLSGTVQERSVLHFEVPSSGQMEITLHDLQGKPIRKILSQNIEAGEHKIDIPKAGLPAGLYLVHSTFKGAEQQLSDIQRMVVGK